MNKHRAGFTLVEMLTVTIIIAVLAAILIPVVMAARRNAVKASCLMNLHKIGQAVIAYRQDNGVFPTPDNAIGSLAKAYPKILATIPHCPMDSEEENHDSYGPLYNYWGYNTAVSPVALTDAGSAAGVYTPLQTSSGMTATATVWALTNIYQVNDIVSYKSAAYKCIQNHTADATADTRDNVPYDGANWKNYWQPITLTVLWENSAPGADFPGLANPAASSNTIVTICPYHLDEIKTFLVLRLNGNVEPIPPPVSADTSFWALSKTR